MTKTFTAADLEAIEPLATIRYRQQRSDHRGISTGTYFETEGKFTGFTTDRRYLVVTTDIYGRTTWIDPRDIIAI